MTNKRISPTTNSNQIMSLRRNISKRNKSCEDSEPEVEKDNFEVVLLEHNKIGFYGEVNRKSMTALVCAMYERIKELPPTRESNDKATLYLFICTDGGTLYDALGAYDHLVHMRKRVNIITVAEGMVASAGTLLMMAGSEKQVMRHTGMLFHQLRSSVYGKYQDLQDDLKACKWLMKKMCRIYKNNSNLEMSQIRNLLKREQTLPPKKCIEWGFINGYY